MRGACKVQVFIRSTVEVRNKFGDAMARNRLGLRPPLLLVIRQHFAAKMNYKIRCVAMIGVRKKVLWAEI